MTDICFIAEQLRRLIPTVPPKLSDADVAFFIGAEKRQLRELEHSVADIAGKIHPAGSPEFPFAWWRRESGGPVFVLLNRPDGSSVLLDIDDPEHADAAEQALLESCKNFGQSSDRWNRLLNRLPSRYFVGLYPSVKAGKTALMGCHVAGHVEHLTLEAISLHLQIASDALRTAAGLAHRLSECQPTAAPVKLQALLDSLEQLDGTSTEALTRPSPKAAGLVSDAAGALRPGSLGHAGERGQRPR